MMDCEQDRNRIHAYVDGELQAHEQIALELHLLECVNCRREYTAVRQVVDSVRGSSPLYTASASLPGKVQAILEGDRSARTRRVWLRAGVMAAAFAATIAIVALLPGLRKPHFTSFAADVHSRYARGGLQLGISSDEPARVSEWLRTRLPVPFVVPNYPSQPGIPKTYSLVGAGLMQFDGHAAAFLAYTMQSRPISLVVSPNANVLPSSGETYKSGSLVFHFSSRNGLKLITWRDRGLSYALVSDVQVEGAQSCIVCHGMESERRKFENLRRTESLP